MKEHIKNKLIKDLSYSVSGASKTAEDLCKIQYPDIKNGLMIWLQTNEQTIVKSGDFSTALLMDNYHMTYPASLVFLDWYRIDPDTAVSVLKMRV